ncbi:MAG: A-macroglobulin complement component, partial [Planctomycetota bacterium]|nr:A-macroglobulin complement component [Planctomycetota bacterium]
MDGVSDRWARLGGRFWLAIILALAGILPGVLAVPGQGGEAGLGAGRLSVLAPERLGGKDRPLAFLSTDKPLYRPGETLYARAVVLAADTFFPIRENGMGSAQLILHGPRGDEIASFFAPILDSSAGFAWKIPAGLAGGRYEAVVKALGAAPARRRFEIRAYAPPRLRSQIEFLREGYGPGETVTAVARIARAEGGVPVGARVTAIARLDGREAARLENLSVDSEGGCRVSFALPEDLERGEGSLAFLIEDGGVLETVSKTIPILLQNLDIAFYPEGGELVAGLPGRIYLQARRPDGKPADIEGEIIRVDAEGKPLPGAVAVLTTVHEGRGRIDSLAPAADQSYALSLSRPAGMARLFRLPPVRSSGAILCAERDAYAFDEPIRLIVQATPDSGAARVTLHQREKQLASAPLAGGENRIELEAGDAEGVLIATVWSRSGLPLAERLLFRRPKFSLKLGLAVEAGPAGVSPVPGGKVRLKVEAKDESGRPVEAVVGLTVTDDSLLEMLETRDQAPSLPVMAYLENEVEDLADARVYFDADNQAAARDIDLLLGTQG